MDCVSVVTTDGSIRGGGCVCWRYESNQVAGGDRVTSIDETLGISTCTTCTGEHNVVHCRSQARVQNGKGEGQFVTGTIKGGCGKDRPCTVLSNGNVVLESHRVAGSNSCQLVRADGDSTAIFNDVGVISGPGESF